MFKFSLKNFGWSRMQCQCTHAENASCLWENIKLKSQDDDYGNASIVHLVQLKSYFGGDIKQTWNKLQRNIYSLYQYRYQNIWKQKHSISLHIIWQFQTDGHLSMLITFHCSLCVFVLCSCCQNSILTAAWVSHWLPRFTTTTHFL